MSTDGTITEKDLDKNPDLLDMSGKEFRFVRRGCKVPQVKAILLSGGKIPVNRSCQLDGTTRQDGSLSCWALFARKTFGVNQNIEEEQYE